MVHPFLYKIEKHSKPAAANEKDDNSTTKIDVATNSGADGSHIKLNNNSLSSKSHKSKCNFKVSYAKHWKSNWKGIEVAHRGLGNSYTKNQR